MSIIPIVLCLLSPDVAADFVAKAPVAIAVDAFVGRHVPFGYCGSVLVANKNGVLVSKGYGLADIQSGLRNGRETAHSLGSVTKQFTAAAILKLEELGRLHVDDSIGKLLPGVPKDKFAISLDQILHHTSGLVSNVGRDYEKSSREDLLKKVFNAPLLSKPGEKFGYSNAGYSVLAAVIEQVSGKRYEEFLAEYFFRPAGMTHTGYRLPDWTKTSLASSYANGVRTPPNPQLEYPTWNVIGNGEMLSTVDDMYLWVRALLSDNVLSKVSRNKLWAPGLARYGYGWFIEDSKFGKNVYHDGASSFGTGCIVSIFPERGTIVIAFGNRDAGRFLGSGWQEQIASIAFGDPVPFPPAITGALASAPIATGLFSSMADGELLLSADDGIERAIPLNAKSARVLLKSRFVKDGKPMAVAAETVEDLLHGRQDLLRERLTIGDVGERSKAFQDWIRANETKYGKFVSAEPIYGLTSPKHPGELEAIFRLTFAQGAGYVSFYWQDGKLASHNGALRAYPASIWAASVKTNRIVLYDRENGATSELHFDSVKRRLELADRSAVWSYFRDSSTEAPGKGE
jgi:CubicO group peptidase (beta-lactamase class C family)